MTETLISWRLASPEQKADAVLAELNRTDPQVRGSELTWNGATDHFKSILRDAWVEKWRTGWAPQAPEATDEGVGDLLWEMVDAAKMGVLTWTPEIRRAYGKLFRDAVRGLSNSGCPVPGETDPGKQMRTTMPDGAAYGFPLNESGHNYNEQALENLKWWAENGVDDILDTVEEQMLRFRDVEWVVEQTDAPNQHTYYTGHSGTARWRGTGPAKTFVGEVMKYKRWCLAGKPDLNPLTGLPLDEGSGSPNIGTGDMVKVLAGNGGGSERMVGQEPEPESEVARLTRQLEEARRAHADDLKFLGRRLRVHARRRDWCGEYEEFVSEVAPQLNEGPSFGEPAIRPYVVEWAETFTVTVRRHAVVTPSLDDLDDLEEWAAGIASSEDGEDDVAEALVDAVREGNFQYDQDSSEVTEWRKADYSEADEDDD